MSPLTFREFFWHHDVLWRERHGGRFAYIRNCACDDGDDGVEGDVLVRFVDENRSEEYISLQDFRRRFRHCSSAEIRRAAQLIFGQKFRSPKWARKRIGLWAKNTLHRETGEMLERLRAGR